MSISQFIQHVFLLHIQPKYDTLIPGEDDNVLEKLRLNENKNSILEKQNIQNDCRNLISKILDIKSNIRNGL